MSPDEEQKDPDTPYVSRRTVLAYSAGTTGALFGLSSIPDQAFAWDRFDIEFRTHREVWFIVGDDLQYDPPAVVHVLVAYDGEPECRLVEFTEANATTVPAEYGDASVVQFTTENAVLGVIPYNRPIGGADRFSRPRCVMLNKPFPSSADGANIADADCLDAARAYWNGEQRECWWDDLDGDTNTPVMQTITPTDPQSSRAFGSTVEVNQPGNIAVIGAPADTDDGTTGAAYIIEQHEDGWQQMASLTPPDHRPDFGTAVDIDGAGDRVIIGAPAVEDPDTDGSAFVFTATMDGWQQRTELQGSNEDDEFGRSVSIDDPGQTAIVGAPFNLRSDQIGRSFVYERTNSWEQTGQITIPENDDIGFGFDAPDWGRSCQINGDGDTVLMSAPMLGLSFGEVRAFRRDDGDWNFDGLVGRGADSHQMGQSLDITPAGDIAALGSSVSSPDTTYPEGYTDVCSRSAQTWDGFDSQRVVAADGEPLDSFGRDVSIDDHGHRMLVGAPFHDLPRGEDAGAVYLFESDSQLVQTEKFIAGDGAGGENFGKSVSITGNGSGGLVGAPAAGDAGKVYILDLQ